MLPLFHAFFSLWVVLCFHPSRFNPFGYFHLLPFHLQPYPSFIIDDASVSSHCDCARDSMSKSEESSSLQLLPSRFRPKQKTNKTRGRNLSASACLCSGTVRMQYSSSSNPFSKQETTTMMMVVRRRRSTTCVRACMQLALLRCRNDDQ